MAEIHIQKKGRRVWPWVIALIAGVLLFWLLYREFGQHRDPGELEPVDMGQTTEGRGVLREDS